MLNREPVTLQHLVGRVRRIVEVGLVPTRGSRRCRFGMPGGRLYGQQANGKQGNAGSQNGNSASPTQQTSRPEPHVIASSAFSAYAMKHSRRMEHDHRVEGPENSTASDRGDE